MNICLLQPSRTTASAKHNTQPSERWHALDALRGVAMLLGVVLHTAVSYMEYGMPNLLWPVHDRNNSLLFDWLFWWIHGFRLPLFFILAGFFSMLVYNKCGPLGYLLQRGKRLLLPLLGATITILPLTFGVWCCGWLISGQCTWEEVRRMKFGPAIQPNLYGPAHLWFLEYLTVMCVLFCGIRWPLSLWSGRAVGSGRGHGYSRRLLVSGWRPVVLAGPAALLLWLDPRLLFDFHNSFAPEPLRFLYYAWFFVAGAVLFSLRNQLECLMPYSGLYLLLSVPMMIVTGLSLTDYLHGDLGKYSTLTLAVSSALLASLSAFGFLGLFLRHCPQERPILRYLADASYWIYLFHFPLVGLVHILLAQVNGPAALKFGVATALAWALGLATYHRLVRYTFLGALLNGQRQKPLLELPPVRSAAA